MRLILKERVRALGNVGDCVSVSAGYGRNFLIPRELAVIADESNKHFIEDQQRRLAKKVKEQKQHALDIKKEIGSAVVEITKRVGGNGKLFGAVTVSELVSELKKLNIEAEKRWFHLDNPIRELGTYDVRVKIFVDVETTLKVKVLMDPKQMEEMKQRIEEGKKAKERAQSESAKKEAEGAVETAEASSEEGAGMSDEAPDFAEKYTEKKERTRSKKVKI